MFFFFFVSHNRIRDKTARRLDSNASTRPSRTRPSVTRICNLLLRSAVKRYQAQSDAHGCCVLVNVFNSHLEPGLVPVPDLLQLLFSQTLPYRPPLFILCAPSSSRKTQISIYCRACSWF